jgi:hypothetical protein
MIHNLDPMLDPNIRFSRCRGDADPVTRSRGESLAAETLPLYTRGELQIEQAVPPSSLRNVHCVQVQIFEVWPADRVGAFGLTLAAEEEEEIVGGEGEGEDENQPPTKPSNPLPSPPPEAGEGTLGLGG